MFTQATSLNGDRWIWKRWLIVVDRKKLEYRRRNIASEDRMNVHSMNRQTVMTSNSYLSTLLSTITFTLVLILIVLINP